MALDPHALAAANRRKLRYEFTQLTYEQMEAFDLGAINTAQNTFGFERNYEWQFYAGPDGTFWLKPGDYIFPAYFWCGTCGEWHHSSSQDYDKPWCPQNIL